MKTALPYPDSVNMIVGFEKLLEVNKRSGILSEQKEKVYVFADYLPYGKHNSCLLFGTKNTP